MAVLQKNNNLFIKTGGLVHGPQFAAADLDSEWIVFKIVILYAA